MKKKSSAEFLIFRESPLDLSEFESSFRFIIPPIYKSFLITFDSISVDIGKINTGELVSLGSYYYINERNEDLGLESFMDIRDSIAYRNNVERWSENNLMPITNHSHGGTILLGYSKHNSDKLFFDYGSGPELIAENIYLFLRDLQFGIEPEYKNKIIYKYWGEESWSIE